MKKDLETVDFTKSETFVSTIEKLWRGHAKVTDFAKIGFDSMHEFYYLSSESLIKRLSPWWDQKAYEALLFDNWWSWVDSVSEDLGIDLREYFDSDEELDALYRRIYGEE